MKVTLPGEPSKPATAPVSRSRRLFISVGLGFVVVMLLFMAYQQLHIGARIDSTIESWGGLVNNEALTRSEKWSRFLGAVFRGESLSEYKVPQLVIDVPFKNMRKIYAKREQALRQTQLVQGPDDFVNGEIRFEDRVIPIKLRLKGDHTDHLEGKKWSFRIRVRDGEQLLGMRRFSIQNPATRAYQAEELFFELARMMNIMTPRYLFVDVTINGEPIGLMALEEFFSKELVEHHRRREGVIVRFDESRLWDSRDSFLDYVEGWEGAFDYYANATVDAIASGKVAESETLSAQFDVAQGLLKGFASRSLTASEVFDAEQLGALIAVSDVFGTWHPLRWHNMRFYFNPISLRLEPIAYDGSLQQRYRNVRESVINRDPMTIHMLEDPAVGQAYLQTLRSLLDGLQDNSIQQQLREREAVILDAIRPEFRMLREYPLDYVVQRAEVLNDRFDGDLARLQENLFTYFDKEKTYYPVLINSELQRADDGLQLVVQNAIPMDVVVDEVAWVHVEDGRRIPATDRLPLSVPARGIRSPARSFRLALDRAPGPSGWSVEVSSRLASRQWHKVSRPTMQAAERSASPLPQDDMASLLQKHPFAQYEADEKRVTIPKGSWSVDEHLVVPAGHTLVLQAGSELLFATDAALVSHGPVLMLGTAASPIRLRPRAESWLGLVVMNAGKRSELEFVEVERTSSVRIPGWTLTGGVNFYRSPVRLSNCLLSDSLGEDALNIINSEFELIDTDIRGTASDAFDSDFSNGDVRGGLYSDIGRAGGGDAIDISGSDITVSDVRFEGVSDKALSVGENSRMTASNLSIDNAATGAAAKDGSMLELSNVRVNGASFTGITAYIKKSEYGPAEVVADNVVFTNVDRTTLVQNGSRVSLDGQIADTQDIDVDALYETVMRKGVQ